MKKFFAKRAIRSLAQKAAKRERSVTSLGKGVRIGLLFPADDPTTRRSLEALRESLMKDGSEVLALGFINQKEFPKELVFKPGFDYFIRKDLDWKGLTGEHIRQKLNGLNLDYLIGVFTEENLLLLHLAAGSNAKFRIGPYRKGYEGCFELMLDQKGSEDLPGLIRQAEHYLRQLKK